MEQINYSKKILKDYYKGGFKGDWIVGLTLMAILVIVIIK